jgi:hypothetical protein
MRSQSISRFVLFIIFFSIGGASLTASVLWDDLIQYYQNKQLLRDKQQCLDKLGSLNTEYDALLKRWENDPNLFKRIAPAAIGTEPEDTNAIYPRARVKELAAARKALTEKPNQPHEDSAIPYWLIRCGQPHRRIVLFLAGAGLILISFGCFAQITTTQQKRRESSG